MVAVRPRSAYEVARRHRAELRQAIDGFAQAVAAPAAGPAWRGQAGRRLAELREQLAEHMVVTEGPEGLYAELLEFAPRLARPVAVLVSEHEQLLARIDTLAHLLGEPDREVDAVRVGAGDLLADLSRHRQRGADLVYEAYATDIGGET